MKQLTKKTLALTLALAMGLTPLAGASDAMGSEITGHSAALSFGTALTEQTFWSSTYSDLRSERYFTYTPNPDVLPVVTYGNKVLSKSTLTAMAKGLESQGKRVVTGINGDLYGVATGAPLGIVVTDGVLRSAPATDNFYAYGVGFRGDGTAFIGSPQLTVTATFRGFTFPIGGGINKIRNQETNYVLYTDEFASDTQHTAPGIDVILTPVLDKVGQTVTVDLDITKSVQLDPTAPDQVAPTTEVKGPLIQSARPAVNGRVTYKVEQVLESSTSIPIPAGKAVLSCNAKSNEYWTSYLRLLQPGDLVDVDVTTPEQPWAEAKYAMGGFYRLVTAGKAAPASALSSERTAYSAVGVKEDGTAVFYTIDGKQPGYSVGATLAQVAQRMVELGCVDAVSLDGGGSTTMGATYPDGTSMGVINRPADGRERANSVAMFLTTDRKPSGILSGLYLTPGSGLLLSGAKVPLTAQGLDTNYYTMPLSGPTAWMVGGGSGSVTEDGVFTAGSAAGVTQISAAAQNMTGSTNMTVVTKPDKIYLTDGTTGKAVTVLALDPNAKLDLTASAVYKGLNLTSQDTCFTWSLDPAVGTVDGEGVVTAASASGSGNLVVSAGGTTLTVPVSVAGHVSTLESFETGAGALSAAGGVKMAWERGSDHVRYGTGSLRVEYDAALGGTASLVTTLVAAAGERYLNLWVYGDGSQNSLTATFATAAGVTSEVMLTGLDFSGWNYVCVAIPDGALALRSVNLIFGGGEKTAGSFWIDQMTTSNEKISDTTPPVITVNMDAAKLTAAVADNIDKKFTQGQVKVTYDGKVLKSTFDPATATLTAALPLADGKLHRVAVVAADASGNLGRGAVNIDPLPLTAPVFADTQGHWAEPFALYLYDHQITTGVLAADGTTLLYQPDKAITRGELFSMVARWLGLDLSVYAGTELPFADLAAIPEWALPGVKAMYALGYLRGSSSGDGKVYANVLDTISRAEAMTVLGRVQAGGYAQADLTFADGASVPDWAARHVRSLVGQGVVAGFENKIIPLAPVKRGEVAKMLFSMT